MSTALPAPLVPAEVNLTDFPWMPLHIERLKRSKAWLKCKRRPELAFYMLNLWTASWHERPAASLENDDDVLADMARCDPARWDEIKKDVMHGWVLCSDGRWYHDDIAEFALESWASKKAQRLRTLKGRIANLEKRLDKASTDAERSHINDLLQPLRHDLSQIETAATKPSVTGTKREGQGDRQGEGEGEGQGDSKLDSDSGTAPAMPAFLIRDEIAQAYALWQPIAFDLKIPDVGFLNTERRTALSERLRDIGGIEGWKLTLEKVRSAKFLFHPDGRPKRWLNLAWLLEPEHFTGLMEGRYDHNENRAGSSGSSTGRAVAGIDDA